MRPRSLDLLVLLLSAVLVVGFGAPAAGATVRDRPAGGNPGNGNGNGTGTGNAGSGGASGTGSANGNGTAGNGGAGTPGGGTPGSPNGNAGNGNAGNGNAGNGNAGNGNAGNAGNGNAAGGSGGSGNGNGGSDAGPSSAAQGDGGSTRPPSTAKPTTPGRPTVTPLATVKPAPLVTATAPDGAKAYPSIVVFKPGVDDVAARASEQAQREAGGPPTLVFSHTIKGWAGNLSLAARKRLDADPTVAFVSPDRPLQAVGSVRATDDVPTGVQRIGGPSAATAFPAVAVIDTGIAKHAELNVKGGYNCTGGSTKSWADANGHGTHVAGTIGARANGAGVVGVAPGAPLYSVRVLDRNGSGSWSSVICGLDYVTRNAATIKVANLSLGGGGGDDEACGAVNGDALHRAICSAVAAGVTIVVAAGNSGANVATTVPAAYDETITVSALADYNGLPDGGGAATCVSYGGDDTFASFSNFATTTADRAHMIGAPGVCIRSTYLNGGFATMSGTSMASPHVAGTAAAFLAVNPGSTPAAVRSALQSAGEPLGAGHSDPRGLDPEPLVRTP